MEFVYVVLAVLVLIAVYDAVAREDRARERTATDELWSRKLDFYKHESADAVTPTLPRLHRGGLRPTRHAQTNRAAKD